MTMEAPIATRPEAYLDVGRGDPAAQHRYVRVRTFDKSGRDSTEHYGRLKTATALNLLSSATQNDAIVGAYNSSICIDELPENLQEDVIDAVSRAESIDPFDIAENIEQDTSFSPREAQMVVLRGYYQLTPSECASLMDISDQSARNLVTQLRNRIKRAKETVNYAKTLDL
jgi:predicted DNA-binding protein (UPF0251 family)